MQWTGTLAVVAASVCFFSAQCNGECQDGWVDLSDDGAAPICVYFKRTTDSWYATRTFCQALGADLAKVESDLHQKVVDYIFEQPDGDLDDKAFWIGGSDLVVEGSWKWVIDNSVIPMGPPQWYACDGQPTGGDKKNCLCLFKPDFHFHSCTCDYLYFGICAL